jgi:hypothetical protein
MLFILLIKRNIEKKFNKKNKKFLKMILNKFISFNLLNKKNLKEIIIFFFNNFNFFF